MHNLEGIRKMSGQPEKNVGGRVCVLCIHVCMHKNFVGFANVKPVPSLRSTELSLSLS